MAEVKAGLVLSHLNVKQFKAVKRRMKDEELGEMLRHVASPIRPSRIYLSSL